MAILKRLADFLEEVHVDYTHHVHPTAFTAREVASAEQVPAHRIAKVVVFLGDEGYGMAVLPADELVDLSELRVLLGFNRLRLATEEELNKLFPDCELGAMPPCGNLFGMPVFVESSLAREDTIAFNGGTHRDVVYMHFRDFDQLVNPRIVQFARHMAA